MSALKEIFPSKQVGVSIAPSTKKLYIIILLAGRINDMFDSNPSELYKHLVINLEKLGVGFIEFKSDKDPENYNGYGYPSS